MDNLQYSPENRESEAILIENVKKVAKSSYADLEYHNFGHIVTTMDTALHDAQWCEENGMIVNHRVLIGASAYHDAQFYKKVAGLSKEAQSVRVAKRDLPKLGFSTSEIQLTAECIMSTQVGMPCNSLEAKILRRADLSNIAGPVKGFIDNTYKLIREKYFLEQPDLTFLEMPKVIDFFDSTDVILRQYLADELTYGNFDEGPRGIEVFRSTAESNLQTLKVVKLMLMNSPRPGLSLAA